MSAAQSFAALPTEMRGVVPADRAAAHAEIVALLHFGGGLAVTSGVLRLDSEPVAHGAAGRTSALLKEFYDIDATVRVGLVGHLRPVVRVPHEDVSLLATRLGLLARSGVPVVGLPPPIVAAGSATPAVAAAALRGAALATGRMHCSNSSVLSMSIQCPGLAGAVALRAMARHVGAAAMLRESDAYPFTGHRLVLRQSGLKAASGRRRATVRAGCPWVLRCSTMRSTCAACECARHLLWRRPTPPWR